VRALVGAVDHHGWDRVIQQCRDLLSNEDMGRYKRYIYNGSPLIEEGDKYLYELWKGSFIGTLQFHRIMYGISGLFEVEKDFYRIPPYKVHKFPRREYF
jgi:hypothetical protein